MDGDSYLESYALQKLIPFFASNNKLGAVTTNEVAFINTRSSLYRDWFSLKFGQRHILFQSHALSNKVLTLTGRFSVLRTSIVVKEDFIKTIEIDNITHWRHGKFRFLMGDDKSSWFCVLKEGWQMLYMPDILCYSLESRDANFFKLSQSLPYRWYGNTLRNNQRVLALGWRKTGFFIWLTLFEQRINMWTSLVGITGALSLAIFKSFIYLPFYIAWVIFIRWIQLLAITIGGHPVSMNSIPLMLYNQWCGALIKIKAFYNLSDQNWSKGKSQQKINTTIISPKSKLASWMPKLSQFSAYMTFIFLILLVHNFLALPTHSGIFYQPTHQPLNVDATQYHVVANDDRDDSQAINTLIAWVSQHPGSTINLPSGNIDLMSPIRIKNGDLTLRGSNSGSTHLVSNISGSNKSIIEIRGSINYRGHSISKAFSKDDTHIILSDSKPVLLTDQLMLLRVPNTPNFIHTLGAKNWYQEFPYVRQQLLHIKNIQNESLQTYEPLLFNSDAKINAELLTVKPIKNVYLENFSIEQRIPETNIAQVDSVYENTQSNYLINGIDIKFAEQINLKKLTLKNIGRNPLNFEYCYECNGDQLHIEKAWNKGKGGSGYIRFNKTFSSSLRRTHVEGIRHIVFQWSSANNRLNDITSSVDINFHGGFSQNNTVENITFKVNNAHPWNIVERTPLDAHWAPPDGKNNIVKNITIENNKM